MDWRVKASLQKVLAYTRLGDKLNHISATLSSNYHENVVTYQTHECLRKYNYTNLNLKNRCIALEIGTGYSFIAPIILFLLGFKKVITVDISKDVSFKTLKKQMFFLNNDSHIQNITNSSILSFQDIKKKLEQIESAKSLEELLQYCNIKYVAPYTLDAIEKENDKFDYICSQVVFEHITPVFLEALFERMKKWLKKDAFTVHTINFVDHFTNPGIFQDKSISEYNFLKFSDRYWKYWSGNAIAYTNRLSYIFYADLFSTNNLEVLDFVGENYKPSKPLDLDTIHTDVLKKYKTDLDARALITYQRGTFIAKNSL